MHNRKLVSAASKILLYIIKSKQKDRQSNNLTQKFYGALHVVIFLLEKFY